MIYKFVLISDEVDDFVVEFLIESDATFLDLHELIRSTCGYTDDPQACFYLCDGMWDPQQRIPQEDDMTSRADEDVYLMRSTRLSELVEDQGQRISYVFDSLNDRRFYLELMGITFGKHLLKATCNRRHGTPPPQWADSGIIPIPDTIAGTAGTLDEEFYGAEGFDDEEFDPEGFEITDDNR